MRLKKNKIFLISLGLVIIIVGLVVSYNQSISKDRDPHNKGDISHSGDLDSLIPAVAAKVNNVKIKHGRVKMAVNAELARYYSTDQAVGHEMIKGIIKEVVESLISEELIYQKRVPLNISVKKEEIEKELGAIKKRFPSEDVFQESLKDQHIDVDMLYGEIQRSITVKKIIEEEVEKKILIDNDAIKAFYEGNTDMIKQPGSIKVSQILIKVSESAEEEERKKAEEKINNILKMTKSGKDFEGLARDFSEDQSASRGGDLGYLYRGTMFPEFEKAAFALNRGEVSDIIKTPFGFHIIKVFDKKEGGMPSLEEAKEKIEEFLKMKDVMEKVSEWVEKLKTNAKIEKFM